MIKSLKLNRQQFGHGKKAWFIKHINDIYVKKANKSNYRSRASFKLFQMLEKHPSVLINKNNLLSKEISKHDAVLTNTKVNNPYDISINSHINNQKQIKKYEVKKILDLGSSPGSWSQVLRQLLPNAQIASVDLLQMKPIEGVDFYKADARNRVLHQKLMDKYGRFQLIVSDMAPNFTGDVGQTHQQILQLNNLCVQLCYLLGSSSCNLIMKSIQGQHQKNFYNLLSILFCNVYREKPASSRSQSVQFFYVCEKLKQLNPQKLKMVELLNKIMTNVNKQLQIFKNKKDGRKQIDNFLNK